jgi:hypothetical protein
VADSADSQAALESVLKDERVKQYQQVADSPEDEFHFIHGREGAKIFGYDPGSHEFFRCALSQ